MSEVTPERPNVPPKGYVTQRDIAQQVGISQQAVSMALRGDASISAEMAQRVREVAAELGYDLSLHQTARRLIMRRHGKRIVNRLIALLMPPGFQQMHYFAAITQGVLEALGSTDFSVVIDQRSSYNNPDLALPSVVTSGEVDGVICYTVTDVAEPLVARLRQSPGFADRPIVTLINPLPGCAAVDADASIGAYQATVHLLDQGHRHLLYCFTSSWRGNYQKRLIGIHQAYRERGLNPEEYLHERAWVFGAMVPPFHLAIPDPDQDRPEADFRKETYRGFLTYIHEHPDVTAVMTPNDIVARRLGYLLMREGYRIPEDISLVGFDDTDPLTDGFGHNLLTTVRLPLVDIGQAATRLLIDMVTGNKPENRTITLPTELVVRGSTGAPGVRGSR